MALYSNNPLLQDITVEDLVAFLRRQGWTQADSAPKWFIYLGGADADGKQLEVVLPRNNFVPDREIYISAAIELLAAVNNVEPSELVERVYFRDRDVLFVRNEDATSNNSVSIQLAANQVYQLKNTILYSACSEEVPKPHHNHQLRIGTRMVKHYQFGHTFRGSFGYTVQSQVIEEEKRYVQLRLLDDEQFSETIIPLERRVMERLIRGLLSVQRALRERNAGAIVSDYISGLNANMCTALLKIADNGSSAIEYRVQWSQTLKPSEDVINAGRIRLFPPAYDLLREAIQRLRVIEPEYVEIIGLVTGLSSQEPPQSDIIGDRSVVVRWLRPQGRPANIRILLNRDDYILAHKAHLDWSTISVTGIIQNIGNNWRLFDARDFRILRP